MRSRHRNLIVAVGFLGTAAPSANAHDRWADGEPIPAWVKAQCCGASDAHHLRSAQVHVMPDGYQVEGYREIIPEQKLSPSPDGEWWVFYQDYPDGHQSPVYCFFGPVRGV